MTVTPAQPPVTPIIAVVGPTATGKSELAVQLAQRCGAEIINADSMQLYQGMDIGTAKLTRDEQRGVPHHLLDVWPLSKSAAVAEYQRLARDCVADVQSRGKVAILVGGSGLYLRGALDKLEFPGESAPIRARLTAEAAERGTAAMHARLAELDPAAAEAILPTNTRRVIRALEVIEITARPFTARMPEFAYAAPAIQIGLDRDDLDQRVEARVTTMIELGLVAEVHGLIPAGLRQSPTAGKALGYQQLLGVLDDDGETVGDLDEALQVTVRATRRFVKRQRSWFRRDPRVHWLDGRSGDVVGQAASLIWG